MAVKVTDCPYVEGLVPDVTVVVVLALFTVTAGCTAMLAASPETPLLSVSAVNVAGPTLSGAVTPLKVTWNWLPLSHEWSITIVSPETVTLTVPLAGAPAGQVLFELDTCAYPAAPEVPFCGGVQPDGITIFSLEPSENA